MDFSRRRTKIRPEEGVLAELYPHDLQMYSTPPVCEISLTEFEQLAVDRLKVLRQIEQISLQGLAKNSDEWKKAITDDLKKYQDLKSFYKVITSSGAKSKEPDYSVRKCDHISHFVLRLAFCRTEDLRRWFIGRELELFRLRWMHLSTEGKNEFIKINNLNYKPISSAEQAEISDQSGGMVNTSAEYFRIPFTQVLDLVRTRKVYLHAGSAFITSTDIISVLLSVFRSRLSHELARTARYLPELEGIEEDQERIFRPLKALPHAYIGEDYSSKKNGDKVSIECIDSLARQSFPLCMRQLHGKLRQEHKLKHNGRLQYVLFLKGIGVTMEDVLTMWRDEWARVEPEKFEKGGIGYLIRHSYGKEGKRTNYTPSSCMKIINTNVGTGDQHGCPFKHSDISAIRLTLSQANVPSADIQETVDLINRSQYHLACTKYFEITHGTPPERIINHPNQYFEESQNVKSGKVITKRRESSGDALVSSAAEKSDVLASTVEKKTDAEKDLWGSVSDAELMCVDI